MSILLSLLKQDGYRPSAASEEAYKAKLQAAIEWMSFRWVLSPNYVFNPNHSVEAWKSNESFSRVNS